MRCLLITVCSMLFCIALTNCPAQENEAEQEELSYRRSRKHDSAEQIKELHNGVLLVRSFSRFTTTEILRATGKPLMAARIEEEQKEKNREIAEAFQAEFTFCPVYFFDSRFSLNVKDSEFEKVEFFDVNKEPVPPEKIIGASYLIAEFGRTEQDTISFRKGTIIVPTDSGAVRQATFSGRPDMGLGALMFRSEEFVQLRKPFPYFVRTFDQFIVKRKPWRTVRRMNRKLHRF